MADTPDRHGFLPWQRMQAGLKTARLEVLACHGGALWIGMGNLGNGFQAVRVCSLG